MIWNGSWGFGGMLAMTLLMIAFWVLIIGGVIWLVRSARRPDSPLIRDSVSMRILDERFARGDLTDKDYRQRRALLSDR